MRFPARLLPSFVAGLLAVTACGSDDSLMPPPAATPGASTNEPTGSSPTPATDVTAASAVSIPERGTCWAIPPERALDPDYWFDDSDPVPCSEPHTTQTARVLTQSVTEPTIEQATGKAQTCWNHVRLYLGVNLSHWIPWGAVVFLPSEHEIANGASWVRCDAFFPATWDSTTIRTTTTSAAGIAIDPPDELWACLDKDPSKPDQPFVPCDQPHQYEQTGTLALINGGFDGLDEYPPRAELEAAAHEQCMPAVAGEAAGDTAVTAAWDPKSVFKQGTEIVGACFVFNKSGEPLEPRP